MTITKNKYRIGDLVLVKGELVVEREYLGWGHRRRTIARRELPTEKQYRAVVTGAGVRYNGEVTHQGEDGSDFKVEKTHQVWLVRRATAGAEKPVLENDLEIIEPVVPFSPLKERLASLLKFTEKECETLRTLKRARVAIPWSPGTLTVTKAVRDEMQGIMQNWPRGPGGRWKKQPVKAFHLWLGEQEKRDDGVGDLAALLKQYNLLSWNLQDGPAYLLGKLEEQGVVKLTWEKEVQRAWQEWWGTA